MTKESFLVIASSLFVFCSYFQLRGRTGYAVFHLILLFLGSTRHLKCTEELAGLEFRPGSRSGIELGSLLVPMVLTSQISFLKDKATKSNQNLLGSLEYYLLASQLMSMSMVSILLLFNKSKRLLSWMLLVVVTISMAATFNVQLDSNIARLSGLIITYIFLLLFTVWLFPKSFTLGEAMILVQACLLLTVDSWMTLGNRLHYVIPTISPPTENITRSIYTYWVQILVVGSLLTGLFLLPVFYYISIVRNAIEMWIGTISFYIVIFLVFISFLLPWTLLMLGGVNPLSWMIHHVTYNSTRFYLIIYWSLIVLFSIAVVAWKNYTGNTSRSKTIFRKIFHLSAIVIFIPGIIYEPNLTHLAASVAVAVFIFLEYIRMSRVAPLGETLNSSLSTFLDEKDTGPVILTHIYLLIGCALPLWLYPGNMLDGNKNGCLLSIYSGVLSLGVGDTIASVVGKGIGRNKWPGSFKTLEGTSAGFITQMVCVFLLSQNDQIKISRWIPVAISIITSSLLEAWTTQIDNLVLPPFLFSLLLIACN